MRSAALKPRLTTVAVWATLLFLALVVLVFATIRVVIDVPNLAAGTVPAEGDFNRRYALHPVVAYLHIGAGVVYLLGAPVQLSRRFRERHLRVHRRMGRVVLPAGIVAGVFAIAFGVLFPWGGLGEASAAVIFGGYFLAALGLAFAAVRAGDITRHRRWMIRAFAVGLGVGSIRLWLALLAPFVPLSFPDAFAVAFWIGLVTHALAAEVYLARYPGEGGRAAARPARAPTPVG